jgi:hypothetical protein
MPFSDEPISVIEDLDPEPPPRSGGRQGWEIVLGLLVLVAVLAFAGWQWLHENHQRNDYASGVQAISNHDWEAAQTYFASASGYRDADQQAQAAAGTIAQRDDQYNTALTDRDIGAWAACLKSIQQVTEIQPGYKDSAHIEQEASEQVYRDAMSGTVALRPNAAPAGLYYYGASGWTWLPKSDGFSKVQGQSYGGRLVYDVPGPSWVPSPHPPAQQYTPGSPDLEGRRLMVLKLPNISEAKELTLDPGLYNLFQTGDDGIWALRYDDTPSLRPGQYNPSLQSPLYFGNIGLNGTSSLYENYTTSLTSTITMKLPRTIAQPFNHATIMDFDSSGSRYLLARSQPDSLDSSILVTIFYLGQAGGDLRTIYTWKPSGGGIYSAQFSPDGRYVLINGYLPWEAASRFEEAQLIDLQGDLTPRMLTPTTVELTSNLPPTPPTDSNWLSATFLKDGPFKGKVLIAAYDGKQHYLRVIDPAQTGELIPLVDLQVPSANPIVWTVHPGNDDISLVSGQEIVPTDYPLVEVPLWFIALSRNGSSTVTRLRTLVNTNLDYAMLAGDRLAYSTYERGQNGRDTRSVFSFPISRLGVEGENAWTMFTQADSASGQDVFAFGDYSLGPTLLAYVSDNDLHARLYDGSVDVVLEHHVTYLYNTSLHSVTERLR